MKVVAASGFGAIRERRTGHSEARSRSNRVRMKAVCSASGLFADELYATLAVKHCASDETEMKSMEIWGGPLLQFSQPSATNVLSL